uniref:Tail specific protease domain-containing protein n=1 Tax=Chlamydomonas euryale TaxID=1486919 RepID=A0A6U2FQ29_9CHLO|mmetsp:Transcript_29936/g.88652  ORF Transcript_29936/g.88652 Transcript_29936/m.88652 type:complete len:898 (+) Transcript_29936:4704-7397(+)
MRGTPSRSSAATMVMLVAVTMLAAWPAASAQPQCDPCAGNISGCIHGDDHFNTRNPEGPFWSFFARNNAIPVDFTSLVECFKSITLSYNSSVQTVTAMRNFFANNYVFYDMAKDPLATPQTVNDVIPINQYTPKTDLGAKLDALMDSWPEGQAVSFFDMAVTFRNIFSTLRDAHVHPFDVSSTIGSTMAGSFLGLLDRKSGMIAANILTLPNVDEPVMQLNGFLVATVDDMSFGEWARMIVSGTDMLMPNWSYKNLGARMNDMMGMMSGVYPAVWDTGANLQNLAGKVYNVTFTDGSTTQWQWVAGMPAAQWANRTSVSVTEQLTDAPLSSVYQSLMGAADIFFSESAPVRRSRALLSSARRSEARPAVRPSAAAGTREAGGGSLRQLQQAPSPESPVASNAMWLGNTFNDNITSATKPTPTDVGTWSIFTSMEDGHKYAVWKLANFNFDCNIYISNWMKMVAAAKAEGVDRLLYDVSGNGGGDVTTGYAAAALIYPELASRFAPAKNEYDIKVGPAGEYMIDNGLLPTSTTGAVPDAIALASNETYLAERVAQIKADPSILQKSSDYIDAMFTMFQSGILDQVKCSEHLANGTVRENVFCKDAFQATFDELQVLLAPYIENPSSIDVNAVGLVLDGYLRLMQTFNPLYTVYPFGPNREYGNIFAEPVERTHGGIMSRYSQPFFYPDECSSGVGEGLADPGGFLSAAQLDAFAAAAGLPTPYTAPFKTVLAVTNGVCGSTCSTWYLTARLHSMANPDAPIFRSMSYGGNGKVQNIQPCSFMGGFLADDVGSVNSKQWAYWATLTAAATFLGDQHTVDVAASLLDIIAEYPSLGNDAGAPAYPVAEIYGGTLGGAAGSAPMEYLQITSDYYAPVWYTAVDLMGLQNFQLYETASTWLS